MFPSTLDFITHQAFAQNSDERTVTEQNPRAHIQLICDWRIKPVEVVTLTDIESTAS